MAKPKVSQTVKPYSKTVIEYLHKDIDMQAPFTTLVINIGSVLHALGPRKLDDVRQTPVYEVLAKLENQACENYICRNFDEVELIKVEKGRYAVFCFKELRKHGDGTYAAYYEYDGIIGNDKPKKD